MDADSSTVVVALPWTIARQFYIFMQEEIRNEVEKLNGLQLDKLRAVVEHLNRSAARGLVAVFLLGAAVLLATGFSAFILRRRILKPVHAILQASDRMRRGDFTARAAADRSDEFGQLTPGFNLAQFALIDALPDLTEGMRVSQFHSLDQADPRAARFAMRFRERTGRPPDYGQAFAYDAVCLLRDAVLRGGYTRAGVKAYLDRLIADGTPIAGVAGTFTLGTDHDARRPLYISEVHDRTFQVVKALPASR